MEQERVMVFFSKNRQHVDRRKQGLQTEFYRKIELYLLFSVMKSNLRSPFHIT